MIIDIFLDQKRVNVCEHTVKMAICESFTKVPPEGCKTGSGEDAGKIEWKSSEVNNRAVPRGQNELIGELKMAAGDMISIRG